MPHSLYDTHQQNDVRKEQMHMSKTIISVVVTILAGIIGIYLGAAINLEGYLGLVFAIAAATGFIVSAIERNNKR